ncbi:MAG: zinc ribbon domain-containing protein [Oscillospiraceae bacterium]|jgi:hypothetical protein|nr:zinc ribbon domain-containing protein [Oscillospiraceae bacterium]
MSFCAHCGKELTLQTAFCPHCGKSTNQQPTSGGHNNLQKAIVTHYAPSSYTEKIHGFGGSVLFLVGIILFSAGHLFSAFMNFNIQNIFNLMLLALPITGFWLIFAASKTPAMPEKTLPALTLFKVYVIINLVIMCLYALLCLIASIALFYVAGEVGNSYYSSGQGVLAGIGFVGLLITGGIVTFSIIYFRATLKVVGGIRNGIERNTFDAIPDISVFSILSYIGIGFSVLNGLMTAASFRAINEALWSLPSDIGNIIRPLLMGGSGSTATFYVFFSLVASAGTVICIIVLNQFNNSLKNNRGSNVS